MEKSEIRMQLWKDTFIQSIANRNTEPIRDANEAIEAFDRAFNDINTSLEEYTKLKAQEVYDHMVSCGESKKTAEKWAKHLTDHGDLTDVESNSHSQTFEKVFDELKKTCKAILELGRIK